MNGRREKHPTWLFPSYHDCLNYIFLHLHIKLEIRVELRHLMLVSVINNLGEGLDVLRNQT